MKKNHIGTIKENIKISSDVFKMVIKSKIEDVCPGQFVSIQIPNKTLRRPFSIAAFKEGEVTILYKLKGEGTNYLSNLKAGDNVDFLAPLGNCFLFENVNSALLIGAGIGIAPMLFLKEKLNSKNIKNFLIAGFKNKDETIKGADKVTVGGSVMDDIDSLIKEVKPDILYSCGPSIVLKLVCEAAERNGIKAQIAMEKVMACGIGVCRGCVIELKDGTNAAVCKDGPVFQGDVVKW